MLSRSLKHSPFLFVSEERPKTVTFIIFLTLLFFSSRAHPPQGAALAGPLLTLFLQ